MDRPTIVIRRAEAGDVRAIMALWEEAVVSRSVTDMSEDLERVIESDHTVVLVAEHDGRLAGTVIGGFDGWRGNIYRLVVDEELRRLGIAGTLIEAVDAWFGSNRVVRVTALVDREHAPSVSFWDGTAYEVDESMVRYVRTLRSTTG